MWSSDVQHLAELSELGCVFLPSVPFCVQCFITDLFMDLSHKGSCRALHMHSHTWPRQILFNENVLKQRIKLLPRMIYSEIGIFFSEMDFEKQEVW